MLNTTGSTLCIVSSPFQCLCMFEALKYFNITDYDVFVGYSDELSLKKIDILLSRTGLNYYKGKTAHVLKDIVSQCHRIKKKYNNFIIGNFENYNGYSIACVLGYKKSTVCYIDDGAQAYRFFSDPPIRKKYPKKIQLVYNLYAIIGRLKKFHKPVYFSVYDVKSAEYEVIKNEMTLMKVDGSCKGQGVYIIGTNSSALRFKDYTYFDYLNHLLVWIHDKYKDEKIFFCPHRRDLNNDKILEFCIENGVGVFNTEVSVEYDFVNNSINPYVIIGFNSNALYTLNMIYTKSKCFTIQFHLDNEESDKKASLLTKRLQEKGINVISLFDNGKKG